MNLVLVVPWSIAPTKSANSVSCDRRPGSFGISVSVPHGYGEMLSAVWEADDPAGIDLAAVFGS